SESYFHMPAYFKTTLTEFVSLTATSVVGELTISNSKEPTRFQLPPEVIDAWRLQLEPLQRGINELLRAVPRTTKDFILLEYPIPMVGRRIDGVILLGNIVAVVETKTGSSPSSAVRQVEDYAINLACFHEFCTDRVIVPVVLSNSTAAGSAGGTTFDDLIAKTIIANPTNFGYLLTQVHNAFYSPDDK